MIKKLLALLFLSTAVHAFSPVRYVQISTNTLSRQTGTAVIAGLDVSTQTVSSSTVSNATISAAIISSTTISTAAISVANISSMTIGAYWMPPVYSSVTIRTAQFTSTTSSASTTSTFGITNLSGSFTPQFSTSRVKVTFAGTCTNSNSGSANLILSLFRDSTDLGGALSGGVLQINATGTFGCAYSLIDTPASTSAIIYSVKIRNDGAGISMTFGASPSGGGTTTKQSMIVEELR